MAHWGSTWARVEYLKGRVGRVPAGGVDVAERQHESRGATAYAAKRRHVGSVSHHYVALVDGVRERHPVAGHVVAAVERGDRLDGMRLARQAAARER